MSVTASGPDGSTFSFPDGTPQEVVRRTLFRARGRAAGLCSISGRLGRTRTKTRPGRA